MFKVGAHCTIPWTNWDGHGIVQCTTDLEHLCRIYSSPTHNKHQWLLLQFIEFLMMDAVPIWPWNSTVHNRPWTSIQDLFQPNSWQTPLAAVTVYSAPDDGRKGQYSRSVVHCTIPWPNWPWNSTVYNRPWTFIQDLFYPNSWQTPVATVTTYSAPDDGRKGRPKHVEHTCSC